MRKSRIRRAESSKNIRFLKNILMIVVTGVLAISATSAWANESGNKTITRLKEIVVKASRQNNEEVLKHVPGMATIISSEDIKSRNNRTVDQILNQTSGVYVRAGRKGVLDKSVVSLDGFPGQQRTLVLMDGQPINSAFSAGVMWNTIPPQAIDRIEVVRGPFSPLYGWNALGGYINIITKMPQKRQVNISTGYGTDNLKIFNGSYGDKFFDKLSFYFDYDFKECDGYPSEYKTKSAKDGNGGIPVTGWKRITTSTGKPVYLIGDKGDFHEKEWSIITKLALDLGQDSQLIFSFQPNRYSYHYDHYHDYLRELASGNIVDSGKVSFNDAGTDKTINLKPLDFVGNPGRNMQYRYTLDYKTKFQDKIALHISGGINDQNDYFILKPGSEASPYGGPGTEWKMPGIAYWARIQTNIKDVAKYHNLTFGLEYREDEAGRKQYYLTDWKDEDSKTGKIKYRCWGRDRLGALFFQDEMVLDPRLTIFLGGRLDYWKTFNGMDWNESTGIKNIYPERSRWEFSPKISLNYQALKDTTLRFSAARAFRAPRIHDLYRGWYGPEWGVPSSSNPYLDPETTWSWETGIDQKIGSRLLARITYFENYIADLNYYTVVNSTKECLNADRSRIRGVESEINYRANAYLQAFFNVTYLDAVFTKNLSKPEIEGKRITFVPKWMVNFGPKVTYDRFQASLSGRYVSKVYAKDNNSDRVNGVPGSYDPYFSLDLFVRYRVTKWANCSLAIDNILDKDYFQNTQAPGRTFLGRIEFSF